MCPEEQLHFCWLRGAPFTHRVVLELAVVHVDDVGADAVQEVLGVGYQHQDPLEPAAPQKLLETEPGKELLSAGSDGGKGFTCTRALLPAVGVRTERHQPWRCFGKMGVKQLQPAAEKNTANTLHGVKTPFTQSEELAALWFLASAADTTDPSGITPLRGPVPQYRPLPVRYTPGCAPNPVKPP